MILIGIILILIIALFAIPFEIIFRIRRQEDSPSAVTFVWLFGLVRLPLTGDDTERLTGKPRKKKHKPQRKTKSSNFKAAKSLLWNARFRYRFIRFIKDIFKTIHIVSFYLRIRLGLDDPADTGRLWAYLGPLAVYLTNLSNATISLEPDFQTEMLDYDGCGRIRIVPLRVIFTVVTFVFSPITIQAFWRMRKAAKQSR